MQVLATAEEKFNQHIEQGSWTRCSWVPWGPTSIFRRWVASSGPLAHKASAWLLEHHLITQIKITFQLQLPPEFCLILSHSSFPDYFLNYLASPHAWASFMYLTVFPVAAILGLILPLLSGIWGWCSLLHVRILTGSRGTQNFPETEALKDLSYPYIHTCAHVYTYTEDHAAQGTQLCT